MQGVIQYTCRLRHKVVTEDSIRQSSSLLFDTIPHLLFGSLSSLHHRVPIGSTLDISEVSGFSCRSLLQDSYAWIITRTENGEDKILADEIECKIVSKMIWLETTGEMAAAAIELDFIGRSATLFRDLRVATGRIDSMDSLYIIPVAWV